jgi:hypothetical protein
MLKGSAEGSRRKLEGDIGGSDHAPHREKAMHLVAHVHEGDRHIISFENLGVFCSLIPQGVITRGQDEGWR